MMPISTINVTATEEHVIRREQDVNGLTNRLRLQAGQLGMSLLNQTKLITAASELARNMLNYANGGEVVIEQISQGAKTGIRLIFTDKGPGIADIEQAMQNGFSTGTGLGLGLPGAKRLSNHFSISSTVGQGTTISLIKWTNG